MSSEKLYRIVLASIAAALLVSLLGGSEEPRPQRPPADPEPIPLAQLLSPPVDDDCTPRSECCRVCDKGKACGDSCISRKLTCRKDDGCACDAADVCREA